MINRIYEEFTKIEYRTAYKTRHETKEILVEPAHNVCGRCGRSYQNGDNKRNPNSCPYCVCSKCGRSLSDRPRHHYVCGYCWGMGTLGYSYSFPTQTVEAKYEKRIIEIKEEYQEPYDVKGTRLVDPIDHKFETRYAVNRISVTRQNEILDSTLRTVGKDFYNTDTWWYGNKRCEVAFDRAFWKPQKSQVEFERLNTWDYEEIIVDEEQIREENLSVVGFYPNVPAYIQGYPLNMYNIKRTNIRTIQKTINLYINLAIDSRFSAEEYRNRGIAFIGLLRYFENNGIAVSVHVVDCSFVENEILVIAIDIPELQNKQDDWLVHLVTDISFERYVMVGYKANLLKENRISAEFRSGFGSQISDTHLRNGLHLNYNDILINDISSLSIEGKNVVDDCRSVLQYLGLYNDSVTISFTNNEGNDSADNKVTMVSHTGDENKATLLSVVKEETTAVYDSSGFNQYGRDKNGFDRNGFDRNGRDRNGFDRDGFDQNGYDASGYNKHGINRDGYDRAGYDRFGYDKSGFDHKGFNRDGYDVQGLTREDYIRKELEEALAKEALIKAQELERKEREERALQLAAEKEKQRRLELRKALEALSQQKKEKLKDDFSTNQVKPGYIVSSNETGQMKITKEMNGKFILEGIDHLGAIKILSKEQLTDSFWSGA